MWQPFLVCRGRKSLCGNGVMLLTPAHPCLTTECRASARRGRSEPIGRTGDPLTPDLPPCTASYLMYGNVIHCKFTGIQAPLDFLAATASCARPERNHTQIKALTGDDAKCTNTSETRPLLAVGPQTAASGDHLSPRRLLGEAYDQG